MDPPPSGSTLTAEQLDRIAQNKKRAQELRKRKRPMEPPTNFPNPPGRSGKSTLEPPAKRTTKYTSSPTSGHSSDIPDNSQFGSSQFPRPQRPFPSIASESASASHQKALQQNARYKTQSTCGNFSVGPSVSDKTTACSTGGSSSATTLSRRQGQVLTLEDAITANFVVLSRSRFKVQIPYNAGVIEIFKRMKTKSYGMI